MKPIEMRNVDCFYPVTIIIDDHEIEGVFSEERIDKRTIGNYHMYDVRSDDDGAGEPAVIEDIVLINYYGSIILSEELNIKDSILIDEKSFMVEYGTTIEKENGEFKVFDDGELNFEFAKDFCKSLNMIPGLIFED